MAAPNFVEPGQGTRWIAFDTANALQAAARDAVLDAARGAIAERGAFHLVLAGGTTPRRVYELLAQSDADWDRWHVYHGDERCLPPEHSERNSLMARLAWLDHVAIPANQIHDMPAQNGPRAAAASYSTLLDGLGSFDLVLLGLGEDGHTASLFPGHPLEVDGAPAIPVFDSPKPPPDRVSLSASRLADTRRLIFLVTGAGKRAAVDDWRIKDSIPASRIQPTSGVEVFIEASLLA